MLKKAAIYLILIALIFMNTATSISANSSASQMKKLTFGEVSIYDTKGEPLYYNEIYQLPFIENGVTYLPIRKVAEALDISVSYDNKTATILLDTTKSTKGTGYSSFLGETYLRQVTVNSIVVNIKVDNKLVAENVAAYSINNTTFLPLRQVANYTNAEIKWDSINKTIHLAHKFDAEGIIRKEIYSNQSIFNYDIDHGSQFLYSYDHITPAVVTKTDASGDIHTAFVHDTGTGKVSILKHDKQLKKLNEIVITDEFTTFGGMAIDPDGNYYVLWGRDVAENEKSKSSIKITKYAASGAKLGDVQYAAGEQSAKGTKNPFEFANADIKYNNGMLVAVFGRTMFKSDDGLNHQSSTALFVDANSLAKLEFPIPYVSHSFDQFVEFDGNENIIFVDRGDAYDRGFVLQKVNTTTSKKDYFVPFYFKMGDAIYQYTFSELGGLAVTDQGYSLVGTAERSFTPSSAAKQHNESRNLFLQLIDKDINADDPIRSKGESTSFRFTFGSTKDVTNKGVVWLTNYTNKEKQNAAHPKVVQIADDKLLILWENMIADGSYRYDTTYFAVVSPDGKFIQQPKAIKNARLNIGARPYYADGYVYWSSGSNHSIYLYQLDVKPYQ